MTAPEDNLDPEEIVRIEIPQREAQALLSFVKKYVRQSDLTADLTTAVTWLEAAATKNRLYQKRYR